MSFVNSICTLKGGTHVKLIVDQICKCALAPACPRHWRDVRASQCFSSIANVRRRHLVEAINKKNKNAKVKDFMVKNHLWVFVNCQIENPAFDSQVRAMSGPKYYIAEPR